MSLDQTARTVEERYDCFLYDLLYNCLDYAVSNADNSEELSRMVTSLVFQAAVGLTLSNQETAKSMVIHYGGSKEAVEGAMSVAEEMLKEHAL